MAQQFRKVWHCSTERKASCPLRTIVEAFGFSKGEVSECDTTREQPDPV